MEKDKFPNEFIDDQFIPYINEEEIRLLTKSLAHSIGEKYKDQELVVIGVLRGSMVFTSDLVRELKNVNVIVDFIQIESVGRTKDHDGIIRIVKDIKANIFNQNVLVVEDIIDSGRALSFILNRLELSNPKSIEVITLFDKPYKRKVEVPVDYVGKTIEERFIVGHGLDLEGYGRNLNKVYYLQYPN